MKHRQGELELAPEWYRENPSQTRVRVPPLPDPPMSPSTEEYAAA